MDGDNIVVGKKTPPPKPAPASPEKPSHGPAACGAMSLQHGDSNNQSSPQKFVHLVGCAKARPSAKR